MDLDKLANDRYMWSNWQTHADSWYTKVDTLQAQGWGYLVVNRAHNPVTVIYWLKSHKAIFWCDSNEFLIKDKKYATLAILKFG